MGVQWLRLHFVTQRMQVWSLVGELRFHMPRGPPKKKQKINETEPILNLLQYCFRKFFLTFYSMFYYWDIYSEKYAQRHMVWISILWALQRFLHACYTPMTFSSWKCIVSITEHLPQGTALDSERVFKYRVNTLEVIRTYCSKTEKLIKMSNFSFASTSRAQQTAELIGYLLNKNNGDRVFKMSN